LDNVKSKSKQLKISRPISNDIRKKLNLNGTFSSAAKTRRNIREIESVIDRAVATNNN